MALLVDVSTVGELLLLVNDSAAGLTAALGRAEGELRVFSATAGTQGAAAGAGLAAVGTAATR
jgi:hypothetical protein